MAITATSGAWDIKVMDGAGAASLNDVDLTSPAIVSGTVTGTINEALAQFEGPTSGDAYAATLTATVTLDEIEDIAFYMYAAGHVRLYVDDQLMGELTADDLPVADLGPCANNGASVCFCSVDQLNTSEKIETTIGTGTHEIRIEFLNIDPSATVNMQWAVGNIGRRELDLTVPEAYVDQDLDGGGEWGDLKDWSLIAIHTAVLDDGRVLTFGGDENGLANGRLKIDVWDPATDTHVTYDNLTESDLFCAAMVAIPGTSKILIAGGDALPPGGITDAKPDRGGSEYTTWQGVTDVNVFDADTGILEPPTDGAMEFPRWYPTIMTLATGQLMIFGGRGPDYGGITVPEIYTYGEGWKSLYGAEDLNMSQGWNYPRTFATDDGKVIYFHVTTTNVTDGESAYRVMLLDPTGDGSLTQVGELPFSLNSAQPSTLLSHDKALVMSSSGDLWVMDFSDDDAPTFEMVADMPSARNWSNMTLLADGTVAINGGSSSGNSEAGGNKTAVIFDPRDNSVTVTEDEMSFRLYHSTSTLLRDGTLLTSGGGAAGFAENSYLDSQIYRPEYLYDENGQPADRPQILDAPLNANAGQTVRITVDDANDIAQITLVRAGASTHAVQMSGGFHDLDYTVISATEIELTLPSIEDGGRPGSWMMFAWDTDGVPSMAPIVRINPEPDLEAAGDDNLLVNGTFEVGNSGAGGDPLGWEVDGNSGLLKDRDFSTDGENTFALSANGSDTDGTLSQTVDTVAGQFYRIEFDATATATAGLLLEVLDGSTVFDSATMEVGKQGTMVFVFRAVSDTTELRFSDATGQRSTYRDIHLDRISLRETDPEYIVNGSFEDGDVWGNGQAPTGWTIAGTGGLHKDADRASDGDSLYAMDGWGNGRDGVLSQTVNGLVPGEALDLSFAAILSGAGPAQLLVEAVGPGGVEFSQTVTPSGGVFNFSFTPTSESLTLRFSDATGTPANYDIDIDQVSLKPANYTVGSTDDKLANGSFENGLNSWTMTGNGALSTPDTDSLEGQGSHSFGAFGDETDGVLTQTIATLPGELYTLSFNVAGTGQLQVEALDGVDPNLSQTVTAGTNGMVSLTFVATGTNTTIRFSDASTANSDMLLDQVALVEYGGTVGNLITNGSFTDGGVGRQVAPTGWTIEGTGGRHEDASRATDGDGYYAIDGWGNGRDGAISQTIETEAGKTYTLRFDAGQHHNSTAPTALKVEALNGQTSALNQTVNVNGPDNSYTMTFTATGANTTIRISDATGAGGGNYDIDIDKVSVVESGGGVITPENMVTNGSFTDGGIGPNVAPTGWDIQGTGGRHEDANRATDGTGYYAIDGWGTGQDGEISQTIATEAGQTYTMAFNAGSVFQRGADTKLLAEALSGTGSDFSSVVDVNQDHEQFVFTFVASSSETTLRFADATAPTANNYDIDLDKIEMYEGTLSGDMFV